MAAIDKQTRSEIVQEYRLAKDKPEQINILAELHATSTAEIRRILATAGAYEITPDIIASAAHRIIDDGLTFGALRNYYKQFSGHDARNAKKVFKDFAYKAWPETDDPVEANDLPVIQKLAEEAIAAADARVKAPKKKQHQDLAPAPCVAAAPFTDEQAGMLIAGLLSLIAEQEARRSQMNYEITQKQRKANDLITEAEALTVDLLELDHKINEGKMLLARLEQEQQERQNA